MVLVKWLNDHMKNEKNYKKINHSCFPCRKWKWWCT